MLFLQSTPRVDPSSLRLEKLTSNLNSTIFDCTEDENDPYGLQDFITSEALKYQTERLGVTYLVFQKADPVAFLTVSMTHLALNQLESPEEVPNVRTPYPALLLGRLAVHKDRRNEQIGTFLCQWVIGLARELSARVGCRYVALHTLPERVKFYTRDPLNFVVSSFKRADGKALLYRRITD